MSIEERKSGKNKPQSQLMTGYMVVETQKEVKSMQNSQTVKKGVALKYLGFKKL